MQVEVPYKDLKHTLQSLKLQVRDSLPYISQYVPKSIKTPEELFYHLKDITTYRNDPKNVELLQTVQTLMSRDGKGDCDCFTILVLTSCIYLGFAPQQVVLVGKSKVSPSHIYSLVYDRSRKRMCSMDLTNPIYDTQRNYPYKQILDFMMTLRLEDNFQLAGKTARKAKTAARQQGKVKRVKARVTKRTNRSENKTARKSATQSSRTDRRVKKADRKEAKRDVKVAKKDKKLIKVKGKTDIIQARQDAKIDAIQNRVQAASYGNQYDPGSDASYMPDPMVYPGSDYAGGYQGGENNYDEFELMPEEEVEEEEQLSGPIWDVITGAGKGIVDKIKGAKGNAVNLVKSKVPLVNKSAAQIKQLKADVANAKRNGMIFTATGVAAGAALGYLISKK